MSGHGATPSRTLSIAEFTTCEYYEEMRMTPNPREQGGSSGPSPYDGTTFYTISDENHFLGVVALVNSLRLCGHTEPVVVTDVGLADRQREVLQPHVELFSPNWQSGVVIDFLRYQAPLRDRRQHSVIVDADVIVLRSLVPLLELSDRRTIVAATDGVPDRFYPEWGALLGLGNALRRTYVNSGFVVYPAEPGLEVMALVSNSARLVDKDRTLRGTGVSSDPFYYSEQDVLNGVMACRPPTELTALPHGDVPHPPFRGIEIVDPASLTVRTPDGHLPYAMHHVLAKPWLVSTPENAYSRLLPRLLLADDLTIALPLSDVPRRFRSGLPGLLARELANASARAHGLRGRFGVRRRLATRGRYPPSGA